MDKFFKIIKAFWIISMFPFFLLIGISIAHGVMGFTFMHTYYRGFAAFVNSFLVYFIAYANWFILDGIIFIATSVLLIINKFRLLFKKYKK